ncbi:MAG: FprA family A-type flavoprotein [Candidatus Altiarchaeota archaeon]
MVSRKITSSVVSVGVQDWDHRLFDELIPLPDGTSYNAYLVKGSRKTALIDTVDPRKTDELLANIASAGVEKIDYVIANHAEKDHSGSIPAVLEAYPNAKVVTNEKCKDMLVDLMGIPGDKFKLIADGETLSLGDKTLEFILAAWVHWPETMLTYLREDKMLFTCDLFGSHLATSDLYSVDEAKVYESAKRYYAEIMMPFRIIIRKHLEKIRGMDLDVIAPSHGPVHDKPEFILGAYEDWTSDDVKNEVVIPYVSMWGSTRKMVDYLTDALIAKDVTVKPFNLSQTDIGELAMALVDAATIIVATPTVLASIHPQAAYACMLANALRPKAKYASIISSYGWGERSVDSVTGLVGNLKVEVLAPVLVKGQPSQETYRELDRLADEIHDKHKKLGGKQNGD